MVRTAAIMMRRRTCDGNYYQPAQSPERQSVWVLSVLLAAVVTDRGGSERGVKPKACFIASSSSCWLRYRTAERGWLAPRTRTSAKQTCAGPVGREPAPARASYSHRVHPRHFLSQCNQSAPPAVELRCHLGLGTQRSGLDVPSASVVVSRTGRQVTYTRVFSTKYPICSTDTPVHYKTVQNASSKARQGR